MTPKNKKAGRPAGFICRRDADSGFGESGQRPARKLSAPRNAAARPPNGPGNAQPRTYKISGFSEKVNSEDKNLSPKNKKNFLLTRGKF